MHFLSQYYRPQLWVHGLMVLPGHMDAFFPCLRYALPGVISCVEHLHNGYEGVLRSVTTRRIRRARPQGCPSPCPAGYLCLMLFGFPAPGIILDICRFDSYLAKFLPPLLSTMTTHVNHGITPYLHVSGKDYLLFESWKPASAGEIFWSCIALIVMSLLDRLISGLGGRFEAYWASRCGSIPCLGHRYSTRTRGQHEAVYDVLPEDQDLFSVDLESVGDPDVPVAELPPQKRPIVTPFMSTYDLSRGLLHATHALFSYTLMLAAMSVYDCYRSSSWMPR